MSLINEVLMGGTSAAGAGEGGEVTERKRSEFWLNVGVELKGAGEDGEDLFVSLGRGIAGDDLKIQTARGTNANIIELTQASNALLGKIQAAFAQMAPGERKTLPKLTVQAYRVAAPNSVAAEGESRLVDQITDLF